MQRLRLLVLALIALLATSCAVSTESDQAAVKYIVHWSSATEFGGCVQPNQRATIGGDDYGALYPAGQRTYKFGKQEDADGPPIEIVTREPGGNGITMSVEGIAYFALNTTCNDKGGPLRDFHENIGRKYNPDSSTAIIDTPGWDAMLRDYVGTQLDAAMDSAAKDYGWKDLYYDATKRIAWAKTVGEDTPKRVKDRAGGEYFCSPNFVVGQACGGFALTLATPRPPDSIIQAVSQDQANKELRTAFLSEQQTLKDIVELLGPDGAIAYKALKMAEAGQKPPVVFIPQGGRANVTNQP